ncbi:MAG: response regulator, partial [Methanophagales archaeon]|nr:response regulator [Methanophagales archaeon]
MKRKRILVVEDAPYMSETIEMMLGEKYEVVGIAINGREAVSKYKELNPDLVTMDIVMEEMDGIQAIREIKRYDPNALILVISAVGTPECMDEAMEAGAGEYLWKPFTVKALSDAVEKMLGTGGGTRMIEPEQGQGLKLGKLSSLERSTEKTEIVMYLHKIYPKASDPTDISTHTGMEPANVLVELHGSTDQPKSLLEMGFVEKKEKGDVTCY